MTKQVKISKNVHEKLLQLKYHNNEKSINDVIISLIEISEEFYITHGTLNVVNKKVVIEYKDGRMAEIHIE